MIKAVIVEDEKYAVLNLKSLLKDYVPDIKVVAVYESGRIALEKLPSVSFDLLFLDIQFNDDFDAFEMLNAWQFEQLQVIFVTSFNQFALKAFKHNAIDYITKPIDKDELIIAVNKAKKQIFRKQELEQLYKTIQAFRNKQIAVKGQNETIFLKTENILFIKAEKEYSTFFYLNNGIRKEDVVNSKHLGFWENELSEFPFLRIHKSYLVNLEQVQSFSTKKVKLNSGDELDIARDRRKEVHLKILSYKTEF